MTRRTSAARAALLGLLTCVCAASAQAFGVRSIQLPASDLVADPSSHLLYASVRATGGALANSVVAIDPETGELGARVAAGTEPTRLALSRDGSTLWVGSSGDRAIRRIALPSLAIGPAILLDSGGLRFAPGDMAVQPGHPDVVAVVLDDVAVTGPNPVAIFDAGVRRPETRTGWSDYVAFTDDPTALFVASAGISPAYFYELEVGDAGVAAVDEVRGTLVYGKMRFLDGRLYAAGGQVLDPVAPTFFGTFTARDGSIDVAVDSAAGLVYFLGEDGISIHDQHRFLQLASISIRDLPREIGSLVLWRPGRLAFRAGDRVYFVDADLADDDGDGHGDPADNCRRRSNADQSDADGDRLGDACDPDVASADTELSLCTGEVDEEHERWLACLVGQGFADVDGDGEDDRGDRCLDTPPPAAVDDSGCSLAQFCAAQGDSCESADWRNDEPRGKARDCARTGSRAVGFTCQPAAERGRR